MVDGAPGSRCRRLLSLLLIRDKSPIRPYTLKFNTVVLSEFTRIISVWCITLYKERTTTKNF